MRKEDCINKIIEVTTDLIQNSSGNIDEITIRLIAERAGVGVGLINYHFETKDNLIEICVQRIISNVISSFRPAISQELSPLEHLKTVAKLVVDFLMENPSVSRLSILGDNKNPKTQDNTMKTFQGFSGLLHKLNISEEEKSILIYSFVSIIQSSFLRKEISEECFGIDFNRKEARDRYIEFVINCLFKEVK